MSSFAKYKTYKTKKQTPITWFYCSYCGKYQSRRTSKIKNPNLIFCDNTCRAKYVSKLSNKITFNNQDIQKYLILFREEINIISAYIAKKCLIPDIIEDLKKQAGYCIFKCLQNTKSDKIEKPYFAKTFKKYLYSWLSNFEYTEKYLSLDFFDDKDKILHLSYYKDLDIALDNLTLINKMIFDVENLPISCRLAIYGDILNISNENLMEKYNMTKRQFTYNLSQGRKILKRKYGENLYDS